MHRLEITSRMAPQATFKAFRPIYNDDIYTYDMQNIAVDLEDRTLVSCKLFMTILVVQFPREGCKIRQNGAQVLIVRHYANSENVIISLEYVEFWPKIYLILYPCLKT
jgi:hypothetical protein